MPYLGTNVINITAKGTAASAFTSATFKASVTTTGNTGPAAKELAIPRIEAIKGVIAKLAAEAGIETDRLSTSFAVDVNRERDSSGHYVFKGYRAVYTISFKAVRVEQATTVHDALTSIEGVEAVSPVFNLDNSPIVEAEAFQKAVDLARLKFGNQCKALGKLPEEYEVTAWSVEEDQPQGKMLSLGGGAGPSAIEIEPGKALLEVTVAMSFTPKKVG